MTSLPTDATGPSAPPDVPGYHVQHRLGRGASSVVWAATAAGSDARVAVKVVSAGPSADRELAVLRAVRHPHVLSLLDSVVLADGRLALVTDLLAGGTLAGVVGARGRLRPGEVVTVVAPLAQALSDLHAAGVQHGDLAPGNVLFDLAGRPFLTDLGTVRLTGAPRQEVFGTPGFLDPVLAEGGGPGPASDVYGLGAITWFALCGEPPPTPICRPPLAKVAPHAPDALVTAVQSALDPDPTCRPSPLELARALHAAAPAEPVWRLGGSPVDGGLTRRVQLQESAPTPAARHRQVRDRRLRRGRPRIAWLAGCVGGLATSVAAAVMLLPGEAPSAAEPGPGARPTESAAMAAASSAAMAAASASAAPTLPELAELARARAAAFAHAPGSCGPRPAAGQTGSVPGSRADLQDQALLGVLAARCLSYRGLTLVPRKAQVVTWAASRATVDVVVDQSAYEVVDDSGRVLRHVPAQHGRRARLSLQRTDVGWRVSGVSPSPSGLPQPASGAGR